MSIQVGAKAVTGFDSRKVPALLVYLACTGRTHPREVLAEMLWEERTQAQALSNLRVALHSLNQIVGEYVEITRETVSLRADSDIWLDVAEFEDKLNAAGSDTSCLDEALDLYQGDFLAGFFVDSTAFEQWATRERERLRLAAMDGLDRLLACYAASADYRTAINAASRLVEMDPLREETHQQMMRLLALSGQRGKAIEQFNICRQLLKDELGIEPSPETNHLYEQIHAGRIALEPPSRRVQPVTAAPSEAVQSAPHYLPAPPTPFIGREHPLAEIAAMLNDSSCSLLTLVGPGGIGKTRLGLRASEMALNDFTDGVFWVSLAPISDPALVMAAILRTLGISEQAATPLIQTLKHHLRHKQMLLLLDNFEQVIEAAPQLADLLSAAPSLKIMVTSREALCISGEQVYDVPPLDVPDPTVFQPTSLSQYESIALFVQRAAAVLHEFRLTDENGPTIAEICARLDGLPLAIELAAARVRLLSPHAILKRLGLCLLTSGPRDAPARQQTLRATIDWSYHLLDAAERDLFARLSVFSGGWTLEAAETVCGCDQLDVLGGLESLLVKSLLRRTNSGDGEPRYGMLETIREYAAEQLEASGAAENARRRHAEYFAQGWQVLEEVIDYNNRMATFVPPQKITTFDAHVERDLSNLRTAAGWALTHGEAETACQLIALLSIAGLTFASMQEAEAWILQAAPLIQSLNSKVLSHHNLTRASWISFLMGHYKAAEQFARQTLDFARSRADLVDECDALIYLGIALSIIDPAASQAAYQEGLTLATRLNHQIYIGVFLNNLAVNARYEGNYQQAREYLERALIFSVDKVAALNLAMIELHDGYLHRAWTLFNQVFQTEWTFHQTVMELATGCAGMAILLGQAALAARLFGALDIYMEEAVLRPEPVIQQDYDHYLALARTQISEVEFQSAYDEGRALPLKDVVTQAWEAIQGILSDT